MQPPPERNTCLLPASAVGRTYPSDAITTIALPRLIVAYGWQNIGVLHVNDDYANAYARGMRDNSREAGVTVVASVDFTNNAPSTYTPACRSLKASGVNVVVMVAHSSDVPGLMQACKEEGMWGQGYAWITADAAEAGASLEAGASIGQTPERTAALLSGMLNFFASPEASAGYARFQAVWDTLNETDCTNPFFNASDSPEILGTDAWNVAAYAYDCVVAFGIAMSRAADPADGVEVAARFREVAFDGASGDVRFDGAADREQSSISYVLYNWVANGTALGAHRAGAISLSSALAPTPGYNITWPGASSATPIDQSLLPLICPPGNGAALVEGAARCVLCPEGYYSEAHDDSPCKPCASGHFQLSEGATGCQACQSGTYQPEPGAACIACDSFTSSGPAATSCDVCGSGRYLPTGFVASTATCEPCPVGATCSWNTTVETMVLSAGHWRLTRLAVRIYTCDSSSGANSTNTTSCIGGIAGDDICMEGHSGPLCKSCSREDQYFSEGLCRDCPEPGATLAAISAICVFVLAVAGGLYFIHEQQSPRYDRFAVPLRLWVNKAKVNARKLGLVAKLKLALTFAQIIAALESTYTIGLPDSWFQWTKFLRFFGDIDWASWIVPSECVVGIGMTQQLLLRALVPLVVIMAMPLLGGCVSLGANVIGNAGFRESKTEGKVKSPQRAVAKGIFQWVPASLVLAFCFTPSVSARIFRAWYCLSFAYNAVEEHSFLAQDLSVRCDGSEEHSEILSVAWILVAIWPVGMVVLYAALLVPLRFMLLDEMSNSDSPLLHATAFLHKDCVLPRLEPSLPDSRRKTGSPIRAHVRQVGLLLVGGRHALPTHRAHGLADAPGRRTSVHSHPGSSRHLH